MKMGVHPSIKHEYQFLEIGIFRDIRSKFSILLYTQTQDSIHNFIYEININIFQMCVFTLQL